MDQEFGGLSTMNLLFAAGGCFSVIFLCFYMASRQLSFMLWAIMLAAAATSLLLLPDRTILIAAIAAAAASVLVLVSGIQAQRSHAALQAELRRLNDAVAALQGRLVLRLGTPATSPSAEVGSPAAEAAERCLAAEPTANTPSSLINAA